MDTILFRLTFGLLGSPSGQVYLKPIEAKLEEPGQNIIGSAWASLVIALFDIFGLLFRAAKIGYKLDDNQLQVISNQQYKIMQAITEFSEFYHGLLPESPQDRNEITTARLEAAMLDYLISNYGSDWEHGIQESLQMSYDLMLVNDQIDQQHNDRCLDCANLPDNPVAALAQILGIDLDDDLDDLDDALDDLDDWLDDMAALDDLEDDLS